MVACTEEGEIADRRIYGLDEDIIDQEEGYDIKILNAIHFKKSMHYNSFEYLRARKTF